MKKLAADLLDLMLKEVDPEDLPSILSYAALYLQGKKTNIVRKVDLERADIINKYVEYLKDLRR